MGSRGFEKQNLEFSFSSLGFGVGDQPWICCEGLKGFVGTVEGFDLLKGRSNFIKQLGEGVYPARNDGI